MYDEPFAGLDPISLGVVGQLIRQLNDALGITSVVVTHDVYESLQDRRLHLLRVGGRSSRRARRTRCARPTTRSCASSSTASRTARCRSTTRPAASREDSRMRPESALTIRAAAHRRAARSVRHAARLREPVLRRRAACTALRVPAHPAHAARDLFLRRAVARDHPGVGPVRRHGARAAGLRRADRYGADESLGILVALSLVRELGPVVAALLFASRAGTAITAEIGLMKAAEQLAAMEMMAVDPMRGWSRRASGAASSPCRSWPRCSPRRHLRRATWSAVLLIGIDAGAFWSNMQAGVDVRRDVINGIIKSVVFGIAVTSIAVYEGYDAKPTAEGVSTAPRAPSSSLARHPVPGLRAHRTHVLHADRASIASPPIASRQAGTTRWKRKALKSSSASSSCWA